ncbi:hypothetical protein FQN54_009576 [Arachnomyces sp. PD_36]|nr:hypothetical protein FQN54_009576 [Arachnomyces sp. PD_36]
MNLAVVLSLVSIAVAGPLASLTETLASQSASDFEVSSLPNSPSLPKSWAGRLPVPGTEPGNTLFFWLFEAEESAYDDNFIIWLNGGPGCSSLIGLTTGNGPISFIGNTTDLATNPYSWTKLGHVLYIDQPVGTGLSTASDPSPATSNDRVTSHFHAWLTDFYALFPHLLSKKTHILGESWAGFYIPDFTCKILENQDTLPINLQSISIGDGTLGNEAATFSVSVGSYMRSHNASLQIPDDILDAFTEADHTCGFDSVLTKAATYPPKGPIYIPGNPENTNSKRKQHGTDAFTDKSLDNDCNIHPTTKEDILSSILKSKCYGPCATSSTALDYLQTRSDKDPESYYFDVYNIKHGSDYIHPMPLLNQYFSSPDVQTALNIPQSPPTTFEACTFQIQNTLTDSSAVPLPPAYTLLPSFLDTETHNLTIHIYEGQNDMLINHIGLELVLQNMTWNGMQGFQEKPYKSFDGGIWTEERGLSYHLFQGAGHAVPADRPGEMFGYVRDVVLGGRS